MSQNRQSVDPIRDPSRACGTLSHVNRRTLLKAAGMSGLAWLTPLAELLARGAERSSRGTPAKSVIVLWLEGGPSQLETFDPHPRLAIASGTKAVATAVRGVQLAAGLERLAEQMESIVLVRNVVSKEGDHERATYNMKTGYRPDPTLVHPSVGAVLCHQLPVGGTEIPRHVSILPGKWYGRGGYLGDEFDAFKVDDPQEPIADVSAMVSDGRFRQRLDDLQVVDREFARGRLARLEHQRTLHRTTTEHAVRMMSSDQLRAFEVKQEPQSVREEFGDTPFGRGCLAALRLIEVGVRCIEVTLSGWDSHVANHEIHDGLKQTLDPAFAALIRNLKARGLLDHCFVICGGEFGRTPSVNPAGGRDHWPHGFSIALAGRGIRGGHVVGQTDPEGRQIEYESGVPIADIHATALHALGINHELELDTPVGRPMKLSEGQIVRDLLA
jgi:uncharacterized protein (DUF1501 family)